MAQFDAQLFSIPTIPFKPNATVEAYAVMESNGIETSLGDIIVKTKQYTAGDPRKVLLVNGPTAVNGDAIGEASFALVLPVYAQASGAIVAGASCGPKPGSWALTTGYPGFRAVAAAASDRVLVMRQIQATIVKGLATAAVNGASTFTIDGVTAICGLCPVTNATATLTIQNVYADSCDNNAPVTAYWNENTNQWDCDNIKCPA